jgi:hypothetical protein
MRREGGKLVPYGIFGANTGPPQNPSDPNFPVHPYEACANQVELSDMSGATDIVVNGASDVEGPQPIHLFALTDPTGDDIYPLSPTVGAYSLYALYDSGTSKVRINNVLPKSIGGYVSKTDAEWLEISGLETVNIRINGLNRQDPSNCGVPMGGPSSAFPAQVEVTGIATQPYTVDATLIGCAVINQLVAHINYRQIIDIPTCAGLATPESGPYIDFYLPGDAGIPAPDLILTLERFGNTTSTDGSTVGQLYWLRNVVFQNGNNVVTDDQGAADPFDFLFDTGTTLTIVNDRMAGLLALPPGGGSFGCHGGTNNGYVIDSVTVVGSDGSYRIDNANICWRESAIVGSNIVDAVIGSNFFSQVEIILDGPNNALGIID